MKNLSPRPPFAAVVLAAGKSTRMRSKRPKSLHPIAGRPLISHILDALTLAGAARIVVIVGHAADQVREALGEGYEYALQAEQKGTGHAAKMAQPLLSDWEGPIVFVPGDAPLITAEAITALLDAHGDNAATLLSIALSDPTGYGRILREDGVVQAIVEEKDATPEQKGILEVCCSIYAFQAGFLFDALDSLTSNNAQGEYYLTDTVAVARKKDAPIDALMWPDPQVGLGVNDRVELAEAAHLLNQRILRQHMMTGVTIVDPATTRIDANVRIGADTTIHPYTILTGATDIGEDCEIGPGARIGDSNIGNGVHVRDSQIVASEVGDGTTIGPFANIRPGSTVGRDVKIGDFVELKKSTLEDGVSAGHFAYLGDATIGSDTNIGAGTIVCNYDGVKKHQTHIGAKAFIGSNSTLIAPVNIGDGAVVAAGSTIDDDVPADALAIARQRQTNKPGWAAERRRKSE
ncbi:MAG TPA: bifunctional UDP-N-acetylglucosamine diphosphorylase/glucosamine-1-phosphate N-acetyltransferase GlmU [Capsulimonadaceae bacterium]|nr:bifunctional UDP-N-acetylglucosamine diphosphorylase/glucosamine-1-phosphate N-acetyltransferase GlmU [Capsulimonadaceae bacterium]